MSPPPGKTFELIVADAYRALGYNITPNTQLPGQQVDFVARRDEPGASPSILAVECKDHRDPVGNAVVQDVVVSIIKLREAGHVTGGVLVSRAGFTDRGRAAAADHPYVTLLAWHDLSASIFDVQAQAQLLVNAYERDSMFREYVSLEAEFTSWTDASERSVKRCNTAQVAYEWAAGVPTADATVALFVLADFGAGKTTFLQRIKYERALAFVRGEDLRLPLFVPLRNFRDTGDVLTLLKASFRDMYFRDIPPDAFMARLDAGMFFVLLDGFDEMSDRSDALWRAELFYALMRVIRSPSPCIITSRPGLFVERGELEDLLTALRARDIELTRRVGGYLGRTAEDAARLMRALVQSRREQPPLGRFAEPLTGPYIRVVRLQPLGDGQVRAYLEARRDLLDTAGTSPEQVLAFINRTYDLGDLASRPLLLALIVDSVIIGRLDLSGTTVQYGPSGLYEIYTQAKLDLDLAKRSPRQEGLPSTTRRALAEAVALDMYTAGVLEVAIDDVVANVLADASLDFAGLTGREVLTDFATCSFVRLDDNGACRFIHKSFRGFFVARRLADRLRTNDSLFGTPLDREVLYFLGGFGPTRPELQAQLWNRYRETPPERRTLRRNMMMAYLYTRHDHDQRAIEDVDIDDVEYRVLRFTKCNIDRVALRRCTLGGVTLRESRWRASNASDCHFGCVDARASTFEIEASATRFDELILTDCGTHIEGDGVAVGRAHVVGGSCTFVAENSEIGEVNAERAVLRYDTASAAAFRGVGCAVTFDRRTPRRVELADSLSVVRGSLRSRDGVEWHLKSSVVLFREPAALGGSARWGDTDTGSIILTQGDLMMGEARRIPCGVFGRLSALGEDGVVTESSGWGVLDAGECFLELKSSAQADVLRRGELLLASPEWFRDNMRPGGLLSAVADLLACCEDPERAIEAIADGSLAALASGARKSYRTVRASDWPIVETRNG